MSYKLAGGISNIHKHVTLYSHVPVIFNKPQSSWLLELQAGWYVYPMYDNFNCERYLLIEVKDA